MAASRFLARSKCSDSSAVSSRPAAFRRGASWKPTSWVPSFSGRLRDFFQRDEAGPLRLVQPFQTGGNQNAVLADERNQIGNRAERDQVQQRAQIKFRRAGQAGFASALHQRVRQLEREAGGAQFREMF